MADASSPPPADGSHVAAPPPTLPSDPAPPTPDGPASGSPATRATSSAAPAPGRLTLIGAGHVFRIEDTIRDAILALRPDTVFVELDRGRLQGLLQRRSGAPQPEPEGFVQRKLAAFQQNVAGMYGADVGGEMLAAVDAAQRIGARVVLVDDPAEETIRKALKAVTWRERIRFAFGALGGMMKNLWPPARRRAKAEVEAQLARYQKDPEALLGELRRQFPSIHRVVIAERDARMSARIRALMASTRHGVAVVGDGHVGGMMRHLADLAPTAYRLADVRDGRLPKPVPTATGTTERVGFSIQGFT